MPTNQSIQQQPPVDEEPQIQQKPKRNLDFMGNPTYSPPFKGSVISLFTDLEQGQQQGDLEWNYNPHFSHDSTHKGSFKELLDNPVYDKSNKNARTWGYKPLSFSHFHNLKQVVEGSPEEAVSQQDTVYQQQSPANMGNFRGKRKLQRTKLNKSQQHRMVKFKGI
jgi:hypothetical protein